MVDSKSQIIGRVTVEKGASVVNSIIRGPVVIGKNSEIKNSFIGPFTSIGSEVVVTDSSIEHSVILSNAFLSGVERLEDSLIGKNTKIIRNAVRHRALRLMIGDDSTVEV
jgi:glucose-1-phosphate thymidylyltransferase